MNADKGTYILKELDESIMKGNVSGSRLQRFHNRAELDVGNHEFAAGARSEDMDEDEGNSSGVEQRLRVRQRNDRSDLEGVVSPLPEHGFSIMVPPLQLDQPGDFIHTS